jgi:hypothetical protein
MLRGQCSDEFNGDTLRTLMQQLKEGVLRVGADISPENRTGRSPKRVAITINVFA